MLLPAEVRPFLLDEAHHVRQLALRYLEGAHDAAPATQDDLWAVLDRYGHQKGHGGRPERDYMIWQLAHFPSAPASTERILAALRTDEDPDVREQLLDVATTLPPPAVRRLLDDPAIDRRLSWEEAAALEEELSLSRASFAELWEALEACAERIEIDPERANRRAEKASPHYRRAQRVLRALARHPDQVGERALTVLRGPAPRGSVERWRHALATQVFARVRLPALEERLLDVLAEDSDYRTDAAIEALVRLGTAEVVAAIEARYASAGSAFRTFGIAVAGRIKLPASESALLRLLVREQDAQARSSMASCLTELCPTDPEALEAITRMVLEGDWDVSGELDQALLAARTMAGWPPPAEAAWEARRGPWRWDPHEIIARIMDEKRASVLDVGAPARTASALTPPGARARRKKAPKPG